MAFQIKFTDHVSIEFLAARTAAELQRLHVQMEGKLVVHEFRVAVSWPDGLPLDHGTARMLESLANVIAGTGGYLKISGVGEGDRQLVHEWPNTPIQWVS